MDEQVSRSTEMHFSHGPRHFSGLDADEAAQLVAKAADVALVIDKDGTIRDAAFSQEALFRNGGRSWIGRKWVDTATEESEDKIVALMEEAWAEGTIRPREINHSLPHGDDVPVRYSAVWVNDEKVLVVFGQDMSAISGLQQKLMHSQLAVEREFARLRAGEMRYRMIFELSDVALVVVDATTLRINDINPAALRLLSVKRRGLDDIKIEHLFDVENADVLHKLLRATIEDQNEEDGTLALRNGEELAISATLFRQDRRSYLLLQLSTDSGNVVPLTYAIERQTLDLMEQMPDAFVITNEARQVLHVNSAFVDLLNLTSAREAQGEAMDQWFERPKVDCNVLFSNVQEHGSVRRFATVMRGRFARLESVEIAASRMQSGDGTIFGFLIRPAASQVVSSETNPSSLPQSDEQITNLVGHMPLKDIVRETTQMIEHLCIDTALELTKGNRVSAARMLGLSRQSLYAKLARDNDDN
ncbi:MAG: transcriptional regulator PpsR [Pseudomonadota bacterium]